jgi:hypothetical protein
MRLLADSTQKALNEKLEGGKLVEDLWQAQRAIQKDHKSRSSLNLSEMAEAETTKSAAAETAAQVLHISKMFITSGEFRKLVADFFEIFHDQVIGWADHPTMPRNPNASSESLPQLEHDANSIEPMSASISCNSLQSASQSQLQTTTGKIRRSLSQAVTKESRQTLATRIKKILAEVEDHPEYSPALQFILKNLERLSHLDIGVVDSDDENISRMVADTKKALENFAGGAKLDAFLFYVKDLSAATADDTEVQEYWQDIKEFLARSLKEPAFVRETNYDQAWGAFVSRGRSLLYDNPSYRETLLKVATEADMFSTAFSTDATTTTLRRSFSNLWKDAFLDERGRPVVKLDLLHDMRRVLPSVFKENLASVHIPRIEYSDDQFDYFADNM